MATFTKFQIPVMKDAATLTEWLLRRRRAGAYRVYADPADLLNHIDEVGGRH